MKSKWKQIVSIVLKNWRSTVGSLVVLIAVFLFLFKKINAEALTAVIAALIAAGYLPKPK